MSVCEAMDPVFDEQPRKRRCKLNPTEEEGEKEGDDRPTKSIESLPRDVAYDILCRLPITSLIQFKCVSRSWRTLAENPELATLHFSRAAARPDNDPCLIFHCDYPIQNQLCFADKRKVKKFHLPFLNKLSEFDVVGSCNGLLCLSNSLFSSGCLYLYNPFTSSYLELPRSDQYPHQEVVYGFGFHPGTSQYKVVRIVYYRNSGPTGSVPARRINYSQSQVQVLTVGSSTWRNIGKAPYQFDLWASEALVEGRLHWVTRRRRVHGARTRFIVSFDLKDEQFREVPKPACGGLHRSNFHLLLLAGCLSAAVYCSNGKLEIWVMRTYNVEESWSKEISVGAYLPKGLKQDMVPKIWRNGLNGRVARVLCLLRDGKILLEYKSRALVCYDPESRRFEDLGFQGMPKWFQTIVHVGSLNWIDTPVE